ncbi:hypothetical protein KG088_17855 [Halomonas sp. TRM85114]|uniref:hypothetical protein n=1 Tax=Halomonas jincaotanensis TaxID=2810616 RepID=UPI001BD5B242|nr:hypothetical protein [Halomonas jincaotanensis]MBS9405472.1 hypothetical protein [Halomonas jincaotanensis]
MGNPQSREPQFGLLSGWQLGRVREALRAYRLFDQGTGSQHTWCDVREAIAEFTGVEIGRNLKIGGERLRQFVEGVNNKGKGLHFPVPQPESLAAIVEFISHAEINLLSLDELEEYRPGYQAALRYAEYLRENCAEGFSISASDLCGILRTEYKERDVITALKMTIQRIDGGDALGVVHIVEECTRYSADKAQLRLTSSDGHGPTGDVLSQSVSGGWGVITPEDTLVVFLKKKSSGINYCYYSMNDMGVWLKNKGRLIYLMRHAYGIEVIEVLGSHFLAVKNQAVQQVLEFRFAS